MSPGDDPVATDDVEYEVDGLEDDHQHGEKPKAKRRTKTGCLTCRRRRIKCGEERPVCKNCIKSKRDCAGYGPPAAHKQIAGQLTGQNSSLDLNSHPFNHFVQPPGHYNVHAYPGGSGFDPEQGSSAFPTSQFPGTSHEAPGVLVHGAYTGQHENHLESAPFFPAPWTVPRHEGTYNAVSTEFPLNRQHFDHSNQTIGGTGAPYRFFKSDSIHQDLNPADPLPPAFFTTGYEASMRAQHLSQASQHPDRPDAHANLLMPNRLQPFADEPYDDPDDPFDIVEDAHGAAGDYANPANFHAISQTIIPPYSPSTVSQQPGVGQDLNALKALYPESPLLNEESQPIFQHFLDVTGPCMSIFDRTTFRTDSGIRTLPWTHELPKMALHHPALAYAILAVGALHLARLGRSPEDLAVDYFTRALCCVKSLLENPETRGAVSTLATILLLAYYEVIAGDHSRWSLHLSGAAKLVMENNFADTVRIIKNMRKDALSLGLSGTQHPWTYSNTTDQVQANSNLLSLIDEEEWEVDQVLISTFMGQHVDYSVQTQPNFVQNSSSSFLSQRKFEETRLLMELYWWFCKQDLFQSMLSGDAPSLAYAKWKFCPPRGRVGIMDKAYASVDHLWLILGRLTEFGCRDRKRKLRAVTANGGEWIPAPGFLDELPRGGKSEKSTVRDHDRDTPVQDVRSSNPHQTARPVANEGRMRSAKSTTPGSQPAQAVPMYGMLPPPTGPVSMSSSFKAVEAELRRGSGSPSSEIESPVQVDLETDLRNALHEHSAILSTLNQFADLLKDGFQPIKNTMPYSTPFGEAVRFSSPTIASLWTFYYVARIVCRRLHPHSPPAAMVSAAVNSSFTYADAQQLGRICAGLFTDHEMLSQAGQVDHLATSAVMESAFALLFAAVQYQEPHQRSWTIEKLNYVANFTGLASSAAIASACEATWAKLGEVGKGPPYHRTMTLGHGDIRIGSKNPTTGDGPALEHDRSHAEKEHESRFVHHDRNLIDRHASTRTYWAIGLLSVEDDLKAMALHDE